MVSDVGGGVMSEARFRKGDRIIFRFGVADVQGVIREDRGPLGINGRHLYLVEFHLTAPSDETRYVELPAEEMQLVRHTVAAN